MALLTSSKRAAIREAIATERARRRQGTEVQPDVILVKPDDIKESSLESLTHSVGCPKFKVETKLKLKSPTNQQKRILHPKPWGARDPKEIPCTCSPMRKSMKSAPPSMRTSPTRELRKSVPRRAASPNNLRMSVGEGETEVMKKFDDFCDQAEKVGLRLTPSKLDKMTTRLKSKLGAENDISTVSEASARTPLRHKQRRMSSQEGSRITDSEFKARLNGLEHRSPSIQSQHSSLISQRSPSTMRGKLETKNVVLELSGSEFPEQTATFTNIFGSMLPSDRFNYLALGGSQFFGPADVLTQGLPPSAAAIVTIDSAEAYVPAASPRLNPRFGYRSPRRRL